MMMMGLGIVGWFLMTIFWIGLILLGVWMVKGLFQNSGRTPPRSSAGTAREILDERYARGELSREQYENMKADLR